MNKYDSRLGAYDEHRAQLTGSSKSTSTLNGNDTPERLSSFSIRDFTSATRCEAKPLLGKLTGVPLMYLIVPVTLPENVTRQ